MNLNISCSKVKGGLSLASEKLGNITKIHFEYPNYTIACLCIPNAHVY